MAELRVLLVAEEAAGVQALRLLRAAEASITTVAVATSVVGAARSPHRRPVVEQAARESGLEVIPAEAVRNEGFASWLVDNDIHLLLNVHSLVLIPDAIVSAPTIGSFNLHPGPLPHYAGLNCPSWAVYNDERTYGVTVHWMDAGIDTGRIAYSASFPIAEGRTGIAVASSCIRNGMPLVEQLIADAARDPALIPAREQDLGRRRYFGREVPNGGRLFWHARAKEIERLVRAADHFPFPSPWGYPTACLDGEHIGIVKVALTGDAARSAPGTLRGFGAAERRVATADEWLVVTKARLGGRYVSAAEALPQRGRLDDGRISSLELA